MAGFDMGELSPTRTAILHACEALANALYVL